MPAASQKSAGSPAPPRRASDLLERRVQAMPHAYATLVILSQADRLTTKELRWTSIFVRPPVSGLSLGRVLRKPGRAWTGRRWGSRVVPVARYLCGQGSGPGSRLNGPLVGGLRLAPGLAGGRNAGPPGFLGWWSSWCAGHPVGGTSAATAMPIGSHRYPSPPAPHSHEGHHERPRERRLG